MIESYINTLRGITQNVQGFQRDLANIPAISLTCPAVAMLDKAIGYLIQAEAELQSASLTENDSNGGA